ncbi:16S rRNA (cytosine967-C5)-methyltransferase [Gemmobacter megaterium]|uniref:16S rRNA (Cytosine967-C5)-methyltransferase n=1 Tax=Gemmobacter megaterium TaxID=1086013 RepID=A0A1N7QN39_9RHOB|nr:RsmB/NOP family class I SAM-dependent RNA methyltransferase [Gemmobacter megaterium]GGE27786.1 SAM-dependent methyltransferase [Gemmobacter megaterium]SIT24199.1 16S rRNA (cytosine967-C5)-methyltransferase [Gemmobacter megaterium]
MTPGARVAAAIAVLDRIVAGEAAEKALVNWARSSRFAGSADRAAVRDHVFDALRRMRSAAALGGAGTGRGLMLGVLRGQGVDPSTLFTGEGHAPAPVASDERPRPMTDLEALDCPDWLAPQMRESLGGNFAAVMQAMQARAPVFLRVNLRKATVPQAQTVLRAEGIETHPHPLATPALEVVAGARRIAGSAAYREGLVELQDAASQAVVQALPLADGMRVLDYCAGGGGKSLAMAALARLDLSAHDVDPRRMVDLPARAARAGVPVRTVQTAALAAGHDLVLADAPCSGSGAWRRSPEARWRLDAARLSALVATQAAVLDAAAAQVAPGGWLAYATCSVLECENGAAVAAFLARSPRFRMQRDMRLTPLDGGDGFYLALLRG